MAAYSATISLSGSPKAIPGVRTLPAKRSSWAWGLLLLFVVFNAHCVLRAAEIEKGNSFRETRRSVHLLAVLIGGIDSDPTPAQIGGTAGRREGNSGLYRLAGDLAGDLVVPEYFNWNGTRAGEIKMKDPPGPRGITEFVCRHLQEHPADRLALVGNSWGGHTALEVVRQLRESETPLAVNLVVF